MGLKDKIAKKKIKEAVIKNCEEAAAEGRFSFFMTNYMQDIFKDERVTLENLEYFYDIGLNYDKDCHIPLNFGLFLNELEKDPSVVVGIHKGSPTDEEIVDMMEKGVINYGHANAVGGSALVDMPSPSLTFSQLKGLAGFINVIGSYHENTAVIFAAFPSDLVYDDLSIKDRSRVDELYDLSEQHPRVKSEYMMGVLIKNDNGLDDVYTRDEVINANLSK